jgi:hypothetical protein
VEEVEITLDQMPVLLVQEMMEEAVEVEQEEELQDLDLLQILLEE